LIQTLVNECDFAVPTAVKMLTEVPANILRINKGVLAVGKDADVVVFDDEINVSDVFVGGKKV
jgi:N-acetylglucosamine-6-phosphate deacetylase